MREGERGGEKESEVRSENDSEEEETYLVAPGAHPEVDRCAEGEVGVLGDPLGLREEVHSEGPASRFVVVVPRELHWATAMIELSGLAGAGKFLTGSRAWVSRRAVLRAAHGLATDFLLPAQPPDLGASRGGRPSARCFVTDLGQKGGQLPLLLAAAQKAWKLLRRRDELLELEEPSGDQGAVGKLILPASLAVSVGKQSLPVRPGDQREVLAALRVGGGGGRRRRRRWDAWPRRWR